MAAIDATDQSCNTGGIAVRSLRNTDRLHRSRSNPFA
jgi:hypothetical protein